MNRSGGTFVYGVGLATACVLLAAGAYAQGRPSGQPGEQKPHLSEEAFKNVRILRGIPVKEFMGTMGYSDYRVLPASDVKMPFRWQVTWVDGQYTINVASVQPNAAIDAARFAKPAPPR